MLTSEHAFDRLLGQALCVFEFLDCHSLCELDISIDNWRADVSRAIALYPAMLCKVESIQLDAKELDPTAMKKLITTELMLCQRRPCG